MVDKSHDRVRHMFAEIAERYDRLNHLLSMNVDRYWRWRTVRKVPLVGEGPMLDVCTGTGDLAIAYFKSNGGKAPIVAADFCHEMLVLGEGKGQKVGGGQCMFFVEADTMCLPFPSGYFQVVSVAFGLRNVADTDRGLTEMVRVCAQGGKVVVLEFSMPQWQPMRAIYGWYFRKLLPRIGQLLARNRYDAYHYLPESVGEFPSGEAVAARMRAAGLGQVSMHSLTLGVATLYIGTKQSS